MSRRERSRRSGLAAMVGGVVGILYAPLYALAYFATPDGAESLQAPWVAAWAGVLEPILEPLLTFARPETVQLTYGKCFSVMVLGWMAGLLAIHARQKADAGNLERWGFRLAFVGALLGTLGEFGAYWIGPFWWPAVGISFVAFLVPALLLFGVGFPLFGLGIPRTTGGVAAWDVVAGPRRVADHDPAGRRSGTTDPGARGPEHRLGGTRILAHRGAGRADRATRARPWTPAKRLLAVGSCRVTAP